EPVHARLDGHDAAWRADRRRGDRPLVTACGNWTRRLDCNRGWAGLVPHRRSGTTRRANLILKALLRGAISGADGGALRRGVDVGRQEIGEERIQHSAVGVHAAHPCREFLPPLTVRRFHVLTFDERALIEQRDTVVLERELV